MWRVQWNRPVHEFLLRHVYLECLIRKHYSKLGAMVVTFFVSIIIHELVSNRYRKCTQ